MQKFFITFITLITLSSPIYAQWFDWSNPTIARLADGSIDMNGPVPKAADGHPDMSGQWVPADATGSFFDQSKIQAWALAIMAEEEANFFRNDPRFHCLPSGPSSYPAGMSVGGSRRIVQHPDFIAILNPDMTYRQVYMDGRRIEDEPLLPNWMGYSAGRWEGETLIIESNGYNERTWLSREGLPHTDQLHITERYTRTDYGHIQLEISYEDPGTFTELVQASIDLIFRDGDTLEVICNESETGRRYYSGEMQQSEKDVVAIPLSTLQSYVGTYQGVWLGNMITAEVSISDGELFLTRTPRYSDTGGNSDNATSLLVPQSLNAFDSSFGLGWIFNTDKDGNVSSVSEVHVSGAWDFDRVK